MAGGRYRRNGGGMNQDEMYVRMLLAANGRGPRHRPLLDLSQVPSQEAQAGLMSGSLQNYTPTWGDMAGQAEGVARSIATDAPAAIYDAAEDPSLANVTNAGVRTALTFGQPGKAGLFALGGLGTALGDDLDVFGGEANATGGADPLGSSRARFDALQAKQAKGRTLTRAEREEQNSYLGILQSAATANAETEAAARAQADKAKQDEFNRSVANAESVRDQELGRVRRFSGTEVGKVFDKLGGTAPVVAGVGAGALTRAAAGPGTSLLGKVAPTVSGATAGITALNLPLAYNAFMTEPDNPERAAYGAYARELPPEHPRKQEWAVYASGLPEANPVRSTAADELYDPLKLAERGVFGAIEGGLGGFAGREAVQLLGRGYNAVTGRSAPVSGQAMMPEPVAPAPVPVPPAPPAGNGRFQSQYAGDYGTYPKLPAEVRNDIRAGYADDVAMNASTPPGRASAQNLTQMLSSMGINVNVPASRVNAINKAVKNFATQHGRMPTRDEIMSMFNDKTLAVPAAVGAGGLFAMPGDEQ
jgi:hypothetical protein